MAASLLIDAVWHTVWATTPDNSAVQIMRPTCGMHHLRPADAIVSAIAVGLQNALKLSQEFLGPVAPPPQAEVEHHATPRPAVLPQIRLVVLPSPIVHLHINGRFICLNVTTAE
jgi:hypothetical protein